MRPVLALTVVPAVRAAAGDVDLPVGDGPLGVVALVSVAVFLAVIVAGAVRTVRSYRGGHPLGLGGGPLRGVRSGGPVAGWYHDPSGRAELRWWDGRRWTEQTSEQR